MSNIHVVVGRKTVLVDTGSPGEELKVLNWIDRLGLSRPETIILTHAHSDHAGSAAALRRQTGARVFLAAPDWPLAQRGHNGTLLPSRKSAWPLKLFVSNGFESFEPDGALENGCNLCEFGLDGHILLTPGHTAGSSSIILASGDAIIGDVLMGGYFGGALQPKKPRAHYFVNDATLNTTSIDSLLSLGLHTFHIGHGGPLDVSQVKSWRGN